jgi:hypothetical protein
MKSISLTYITGVLASRVAAQFPTDGPFPGGAVLDAFTDSSCQNYTESFTVTVLQSLQERCIALPAGTSALNFRFLQECIGMCIPSVY